MYLRGLSLFSFLTNSRNFLVSLLVSSVTYQHSEMCCLISMNVYSNDSFAIGFVGFFPIVVRWDPGNYLDFPLFVRICFAF